MCYYLMAALVAPWQSNRMPMARGTIMIALALLLLPARAMLAAGEEPGFKTLFGGTSLKGGILKSGYAQGYVIRDGNLICAAEGGGNLFTEGEYSDFLFPFEFKMGAGANGGIAVRAPLEGNPSYLGMEIQILDNSNGPWGKLRPEQLDGAVYGVLPARTGYLRLDEWNTEEIMLLGRRLRVVLNGVIILDNDLDIVCEPEVLKKHPGLARSGGHIGFLGHGSDREFRNIRIKELR